MEEKEKEYKGIWMQLGCILSLVAILGIIALFIMGIYLLIGKY
ncbi:hypothetical protein [Flagellimonas pelagia]|nr:hypothetical protein [Allomuricauda maritima]